MAELISILRNRIVDSDNVNAWLLSKVQCIVEKTSNHLKYITQVMPEFDLHDASHSKAILKIIEELLGDAANSISSFELFFIITSAYLHDCGMALSDYETKVMELTEGTDDKFINKNSIKNDGKKCFTFTEARNFITQEKNTIYQDFNGEIKNWLFVPNTEKSLIDYLADFLIEYQDFRNGNFATINESLDFSKLNKEIRIDFIRRTHHKRIFTYIRHLGDSLFSDFPITGQGKRITNDLAAVCAAHGESVNYLCDLNTHIEYCGRESSNLQFVAMLLRIGDIMHFSFDRAPSELRSLHQFESKYSYAQWRVKTEGVNFIITKGSIAFRAFFTIPSDYYLFMRYLDWIDNELSLFHSLSVKWDDKYKISLCSKVDRKNISYDNSVFIPVPGLKFTLNQKRILDLLMGIGLYKNSYACIRELYQNALDACRCQIAKDSALGKLSKGCIEFGLGDEGGEIFLYCLDNGKGMSKSIIENYLLKIGSSYYQSPDFIKSQAETGFKFTPTSQFGIGLLSCFIIGNRIEIVTKQDEGDFIACSIDGPHECFYYKSPSNIDQDCILSSGSLVKVYLKEEYKEELNVQEINNLGLIMYDSHSYMRLIPELKDDLHNDLHNWTKSLYRIINDFVEVVPDMIDVCVKWHNNTTQKVFSKPIIFNEKTLELTYYDILDKISELRGKVSNYQLNDYYNFIECRVLDIKYLGVEFISIIKLPKPGIEKFGIDAMRNIPILMDNGFCVDGIIVERASFNFTSFAQTLSRHGILNFFGDNRPQLSVDRTDIINQDGREYDDITRNIAKSVIEEAISCTHEHIKKYKIIEGTPLYNMIWKSVFDTFCYSSSIFIETLSNSYYQGIKWDNLSSLLDMELTIGDFVQKDRVTITNYNYFLFNEVSQNLIMNKLFSASEIIVRENVLEIVCEHIQNKSILSLSMSDDSIEDLFLACSNDYGHTFDEYDIISNLYPIIPNYLFKIVYTGQHEQLNKHFKKIMNYSNGIAAFYEQNPLEIDEELGLYMDDQSIFGQRHHIRYLYTKRPSFCFTDIYMSNQTDKTNYRLALTAFIAPKKLTDNELKELEDYKVKNPSYYKGVTEGWSLIVTGENDEKMNTFIKAGKCSREDLVQLLPDSFWEKYGKHIHIFPNGIKLKDCIHV